MNKKTLLPTSIKQPSFKKTLPLLSDDRLKGELIEFSFELLDLGNDLFNLGGVCEKWFKDLFVRFKEISNIKFTELRAGYHHGFRFHKHDIEKINAIPANHNEQHEFYQFSISQGNGRVHGYLIGRMFYIVWLDPHHNLYTMENYGGVKKYTALENCCGFNAQLEMENEKLKEEISELMMMLEDLTQPKQ